MCVCVQLCMLTCVGTCIYMWLDTCKILRFQSRHSKAVDLIVSISLEGTIRSDWCDMLCLCCFSTSIILMMCVYVLINPRSACSQRGLL